MYQATVPFTRRLPQPHHRQTSNEKYEALDGVRLQTKKECRERHKPTRRNDHLDVWIPRCINLRHGIQIGAEKMMSGFAREIDLNRRGLRTAELLGQPGRRNWVAIRVPAITSGTFPKNQFFFVKPNSITRNGRHGGFGRQALQVRILEKVPKNLDAALHLSSRLKAIDIMVSKGPEAEKKNQHSYVPQPAARNPPALVKRRFLKKS